MKTIHQQIQQLGSETHAIHDANFFPREVSRAQQVLRTLLDLYEDILYVQTEGIYEVTVRSHTREVTVRVNEIAANQVAEDLFTLIGNRCDEMAQRIEYSAGMIESEGESLRRMHLFNLLLTPVDHAGMPAGEATARPQISAKEALAEPKSRRRATAADQIPEDRQRIN